MQIKIDNFSLSLHGTELVHDCTLELNYGRRYGLIGLVRPLCTRSALASAS